MARIRRLRTIAVATLASTAVSATAGAAGPATGAASAGPAAAAPRADGPSQSAGANRKAAAQRYDQAVAAYEQGKYADAARAFYEADGLAPSSDALSSALAAARLANDHLLVAEAAERAIGRESSDAKLAGDARVALADAEAHLARVELGCQPAPCRVSVDDTEVPAGRLYVLPGTHVFSAEFADSGGHAEQREALGAGSLYTMTLEAPRAPTKPMPAEAGPKPASIAASDRDAVAPRHAKPLRPWVFYSGVGVTVMLAGVTTWSGFDALSKVDHFKKTRTTPDRELALESERRTDYLLAGTAAIAAVTAFAGVTLVDFGPKQTLLVAPERGGALVSWSGEL